MVTGNLGEVFEEHNFRAVHQHRATGQNPVDAAVAALGLAKAVKGVPAGVDFFLGDLK